MNWERATPLLQAKLDPAHIKPPPKGKFGNYVDGYHVISEANRIFGEGGWSYEITRLQLVSEQTVTLQGRDGKPYDQFRVGYLCTVKVCIGVTSYKEGAAVGSGVGSPLNVADHHESAVKEAETDALKRALRTYGNTFGLALYDKDKTQIGVDAPPFDAAACDARLRAGMAKLKTKQQAQDWWKSEAEARVALKGHAPQVYDKFYADFAALTLTDDPALQAPPPKQDGPYDDPPIGHEVDGHLYQ